MAHEVMGNYETEEATRWQRLSNAAKHYLAPLAIVAAGLVTAPAAFNTDEAIARQSHPVFHFR
ncbi:MAG TPA: hypothetical protein VM535_02165, partial [Candidatus Saccharimonadales bacterium]|nr:hypothetical protein [Candidatus Saccharimonadales bacterium]